MQTTDLAYTKKDDIVSEFYHEWGTETEALLGFWKNVNPKTGQIARVEVIVSDDKISLHCFGKLEQGEKDWGIAPCELFSSNVGSPGIEGFICNFDFDFMQTRIAGNMKYGVMVIQSYNTFNDGSNRNNYFSREFFCK
jgi:hypothetical protein